MKLFRPSVEPPREVPANDVFAALTSIISFQETIMSALTDLQAQVDAAVAANQAAVTLIQSLTAELAAAKAASSDDAALVAETQKLATSTAAVNAAVSANAAPAAPVTEAAPSSTEPASAAPSA